MNVIGVTGKSGSGKSTFSNMLAQKLNARVINIDEIGHEALVQPEIIKELVKCFGYNIKDDDKINRKKLGAIVFSNQQAMKELTNLTWPYIKKTVEDIIKKSDTDIILEWLLLPNTYLWEKCDIKILIEANQDIRKKKVLERDSITEKYFEIREKNAILYDIYKFDYCVTNQYELKKMKNIVEEIYLKLK